MWQVASSRLFFGAGFDVRLGTRDTLVNGGKPPDGLGVTNHDGIGKRHWIRLPTLAHGRLYAAMAKVARGQKGELQCANVEGDVGV